MEKQMVNSFIRPDTEKAYFIKYGCGVYNLLDANYIPHTNGRPNTLGRTIAVFKLKTLK